MNEHNPLFSHPWPWQRLGIKEAWQCVKPGNSSVTVAVIDSGIDQNHRDLKRHLLKAKAIPIFGSDTRDDDDHGTSIAGTIAACTCTARNSRDEPRVKILPVKFCSQQVPPNAGLGAQAITMALDAKYAGTPMVIVLAWDCGFNSPALRQAIQRAGREGVTVVVAAGNQALDNDWYPNWPADYGTEDHVITVMATDKDNRTEGYNHDWINQRAWFSSFGKTTVAIAAPGAKIMSTVPYCTSPVSSNGILIGYREHSGTSTATANVAGLVALMLLNNPSARPDELKRHLCAAAKPARPRLQNASGGVAHGQAVCGPIAKVRAVRVARNN
jgi:subtilisin family serine protease